MRVLDGPMGSELSRRGADTSSPLWSARPMRDQPDLVTQIHADFRRAGATMHRANTFRTRRRTVGVGWEALVRQAVASAREGAGPGAEVAGSVGPLEDCYRPELAPPSQEARVEHEELVKALVDAGVDLLFCETFPNAREAAIAVAACARTGLPVWASLTAGPSGELHTPEEIAAGARACVAAGASCVLVNCVAAELTLPYVEALASVGVPFGAYANASRWNEPPISEDGYLVHARAWAAAGATVLGCCCGNGVGVVRALAEEWGPRPS